MRALVVSQFLSVDGVMQGPGGPEEDRSGGFDRGGWTVNYWDDDMRALLGDWNQRADSLLLGRKTYEIFAAHWPFAPKDDPIAPKLNAMPKFVASRTLKKLDWNNSSLIQDPVSQGVAKIKQGGSGIMLVFGSGELVRSLLGHNLIDEFLLWVFPLVLGKGKRLFDEGVAPAGLKLQEAKPFGTGVVLQRYQPAGKPSYGSFLNPNPPQVELERRRRFAEAEA
jgi:dihydrofolate reductase